MDADFVKVMIEGADKAITRLILLAFVFGIVATLILGGIILLFKTYSVKVEKKQTTTKLSVK